jgi:hypothetical protein
VQIDLVRRAQESALNKRFVTVTVVLVLLVALKILQSFGTGEDSLAWVRDLARPFAHAYLWMFGKPEIALLLGFFMAVACGAFLIQFWTVHFLRVHKSITDATFNIMSACALPTVSPIEAVERICVQVSVLSDQWQVFRASLVVDNDSAALRSVRRPGEFFTLGALESNGVPIQFYTSLPNYFVGFGLVFTFMGLVAGLYFASRGLQSSDFATTRLALGQLLNASTMKFTTSVVGVGASLVTSIFVNRWVTRFASDLHHFCTALEVCFPPTSPETMLLRQFGRLGPRANPPVAANV